MGVTGITNSKLFKLRTVNLNEPYKVGLNGVTSIVDTGNGTSDINYTLNDIRYITTVKNSKLVKSDNSKTSIASSKVGEIVKNKTLTNSVNINTIVKTNSKTNQVLNFEPTNDDSVKPLIKYSKIRDEEPITLLSSFRSGGELPNQGKTQLVSDTIVMTDKFSYENFIDKKIYKNGRYVGLISKPNVTSDVFMERDVSSSFERHQRLSEINNLSSLINYKNGYFNVVNTF